MLLQYHINGDVFIQHWRQFVCKYLENVKSKVTRKKHWFLVVGRRHIRVPIPIYLYSPELLSLVTIIRGRISALNGHDGHVPNPYNILRVKCRDLDIQGGEELGKQGMHLIPMFWGFYRIKI